MKKIVTITVLIGAFSSAAASQKINEQTLTQVVEAKGTAADFRQVSNKGR